MSNDTNAQATSFFTLALVSTTGQDVCPSTDIYAIKYRGAEVCRVMLITDLQSDIAKVTGRPVDLPYIYSGHQLVGLVDSFLCDMLVADGEAGGVEFYADLFTDENGNQVEFPFDAAFEKIKPAGR